MSEAAPAEPPDDSAQVGREEQRAARERLVAGGARWFYAIGILSAINSLLFLLTGSLTFIFGLTLTQIVDGVSAAFARVLAQGSGAGAATAARLAGFALDLAIAGAFVAFGVQARQRRSVPVMVGVALYMLDGLLSLIFRQVLGLAFHAVMLWGIWRGMKALNELNDMEGGLAA